MTDPVGAAGAEVKAAGNATVNEVEHFLTVLFDIFIPLLALILGICAGPWIFTGQCITDGLANVGLSGKYQSAGFLLGHLAGGGLLTVGGWSVWKYSEGKSSYAFYLSRFGAGFLLGWGIADMLMGVYGYLTEQTTGGAVKYGWLDGAFDNAAAGLQNLIASVPKPP